MRTIRSRLAAWAYAARGWMLVLAAASASAAVSASAAAEEGGLRVVFDVRLCTEGETAAVEIRVEQDAAQLRALRFELPGERMRGFEGDGEIRRSASELVWQLPAQGGALRYVAVVDHLRDPAEYDARCAEDWALLRGSDLVPITTATVVEGAAARTRLRVRLPVGWEVVTPFEAVEPGLYRIDRPGRVFDAPRGWIMAGELRVLQARIGATQVTFASPRGHDTRDRARRALLRWTLPLLNEVFGDESRRWLIVSADDPMWRGGLSGPASTFLHADRPLIDSDGTSPLLHEIVHVVMRADSGESGDWIVEGLAELYSLELLRRSGTVSQEEWEQSFARLRAAAQEAGPLGTGPSQGDTTRRAVVVLHALDERIRSATKGAASLDDVVRRLMASADAEPLTQERLRREAEHVAGVPLADFFDESVE